jgi:hypothetical protein
MEKQWVLSVKHTILHILDTVGIKVSDEKIIMLVPRRLFFAAQQRIAIAQSPKLHQKNQL